MCISGRKVTDLALDNLAKYLTKFMENKEIARATFTDTEGVFNNASIPSMIKSLEY